MLLWYYCTISTINTIASTISLVQEVHTAHHVDQMSKNITLALAAQEIIDSDLETKVNALEEAVLSVGQKLQFKRI